MQFFSIIGVQRCGTTYLYHLLNEHPQISMAEPLYPEPKFFLDNSKVVKGKEYYLCTYYPKNNTLIGEKGTSYIESEEALMNIRKLFTDAKILIILRNPVYRAISNYAFSLKNGLETRTPEEVFLEKKPEPSLSKKISVNPFNYLERGHYKQYLDKVFQIFPDYNVKITLLEELTSNPTIIQDIYSYMNLNPIFKPKNIDIPANKGPKNISISQAVIDYLYKYYKPYNKELKNYISIEKWQ